MFASGVAARSGAPGTAVALVTVPTPALWERPADTGAEGGGATGPAIECDAAAEGVVGSEAFEATRLAIDDRVADVNANGTASTGIATTDAVPGKAATDVVASGVALSCEAPSGVVAIEAAKGGIATGCLAAAGFAASGVKATGMANSDGAITDVTATGMAATGVATTTGVATGTAMTGIAEAVLAAVTMASAGATTVCMQMGGMARGGVARAGEGTSGMLMAGAVLTDVLAVSARSGTLTTAPRGVGAPNTGSETVVSNAVDCSNISGGAEAGDGMSGGDLTTVADANEADASASATSATLYMTN